MLRTLRTWPRMNLQMILTDLHAENGAVNGKVDYPLDKDDDLEGEEDDGEEEDELDDEEEEMEKLLEQQEKEEDPNFDEMISQQV